MTAQTARFSIQHTPQSEVVPTIQLLRQMQATQATGAEGQLAATLLCALESAAGGSALAQSTLLAMGWLDSLLAEHDLPPAFVADLESLRWVIIKSAIADPSFFAPHSHPVRKVVDALVLNAAFSHLQGRSLDVVRNQLRDAASHISIQSEFVLGALPRLQILNPNQVQQFLGQVENERNRHREGLLYRVRAFVQLEIERHTLNLSLSAAVCAELINAFLPLLTTLMLRYGAVASSSREALLLLERFVDSFSGGTSASERQALLSMLCDTLRSACLPAAHMRGIAVQLSRIDIAWPQQWDARFSARQLSD